MSDKISLPKKNMPKPEKKGAVRKERMSVFLGEDRLERFQEKVEKDGYTQSDIVKYWIKIYLGETDGTVPEKDTKYQELLAAVTITGVKESKHKVALRHIKHGQAKLKEEQS